MHPEGCISRCHGWSGLPAVFFVAGREGRCSSHILQMCNIFKYINTSIQFSCAYFFPFGSARKSHGATKSPTAAVGGTPPLTTDAARTRFTCSSKLGDFCSFSAGGTPPPAADSRRFPFEGVLAMRTRPFPDSVPTALAAWRQPSPETMANRTPGATRPRTN